MPPRPTSPLRRWFRWILLSLLAPGAAGLAAPAGAGAVEVRKIWDQGEHNAFTDLVHWHGRWWCSFREAADHVGGDGAIRVIESGDGETWTSAAYVTEKDVDLRDPKLSVTPDGRLMINCGGSVYLGTKDLKSRRSRVLFSTDGRNWTPPQKVLHDGEWLWRVTWHQGTAFGITYGLPVAAPGGKGPGEWPLKLYKSADGLEWTLVTPLAVTGRPNESTVRFKANGDMIALVRRETGNTRGFVGTSSPPYTAWTWQESNHRFGGQNLVELPGGLWLVGSRDYTQALPGTTKPASLALSRLGADGKLAVALTLPSGGDCSYPGLAWHEGRLWVSYYSSHEGKTSIYLARIRPEALGVAAPAGLRVSP